MPLPKSVTKAELARVLKKDPRSITNYQNEGMPVERGGRRPMYALDECVAWYVDREREAARSGKGLNELDQMRTRKTLADARKAELEVEQLEGRLLPAELFEERVTLLCERLAARCKTLGRYRGEVQRAMTDAEADELLERVQDELLAALAGTADDDSDGNNGTDPADDGARAA